MLIYSVGKASAHCPSEDTAHSIVGEAECVILKGVEVRVHTVEGWNWEYVKSAYTDEHGCYEADNLTANTQYGMLPMMKAGMEGLYTYEPEFYYVTTGGIDNETTTTD
jgi:hypothetical protein